MHSRVKTAIVSAAYVVIVGWMIVRVPEMIGRSIASRSMFSEHAIVRIPEAKYSATVEVARTEAERVQGLSGRASLTANGGMLFVFDTLDQHRIWMKDMRFSIDLIWIAGGVVVDTHEQLPVPAPGTSPQRLPTFNPRPQALLVVEVPAGTVARHHIVPGQRVAVTFDDAGRN